MFPFKGQLFSSFGGYLSAELFGVNVEAGSGINVGPVNAGCF